MTRPAAERSVLALRARLDRGELGRALGLPAADAMERADAIGAAWDRDLDPQLLAQLGPGDCGALAALLTDLSAGPTTLGDLAAAVPAVAAHVDDCETCSDRRRAMVSVRTLFTQADTPPAPEEVREAFRRARRMRPAPAPPPIEAGHRRPAVIVAVVLVTLAVLAAGVGTAAAISRRHGGRARRVAALVKVPAGTPLGLTVRGDVVEVINRSRRTVGWTATADAPWLMVRPGRGTLPAGATAALTARVLSSSPEGPIRTTITISGDDGSAAAAVYTTTVERPPDIAPAAAGCAITAQVDDASGVADVTLRWTDAAGAERLTPMTSAGNVYRGALAPGTAVDWWIVARDTRGNEARSPEVAAACA
jgi:hypothetical protein